MLKIPNLGNRKKMIPKVQFTFEEKTYHEAF